MGITDRTYIVRHNKTELVYVPVSEKYNLSEVFVAANQSIEASVLIVMSARSSIRSHETSCVHWTSFREISSCGFVLKLVEKIQVCYIGQQNKHFT